jgi:hypothetical protein
MPSCGPAPAGVAPRRSCPRRRCVVACREQLNCQGSCRSQAKQDFSEDVPLRKDRFRWGDRPRRPRCRHGAERPVASGASIKPGEPGEALHREARAARCGRRAPPFDVPCRCASTAAGDAIGRAALGAGIVASGASIKPGEPGAALHREPLDAGAPRSSCLLSYAIHTPGDAPSPIGHSRPFPTTVRVT